MKELLTELRNKVLYLRNTDELSAKGELILLHKLNALEKQFAICGVSKSLKTKKELTIGEYFSDYKKDSKIYEDYTIEEVNGISDFIHGYILAKQKL